MIPKAFVVAIAVRFHAFPLSLVAAGSKHEGMRVAFDVCSLHSNSPTGIGQYTIRLFRALQGRVDVDPVLKVSRFRQGKIVRGLIGRAPRFYHPALRSGLASHDVFHGPDFRVPTARGFAKVVTVHDLGPLESGFHSERFMRQAREDMARLFARGRPDLVLAVSDFTRRELQRHFPLFRDRVAVVHHGADHFDSGPIDREAAEAALRRWGVRRDYVLFVGTLELRKNISRLLKSFHASDLRSRGFQLVLVGRDLVGVGEFLDEMKNDVVRLGYVDDELLRFLYRKAACFVFPSLYEGFGFPILEAMAQGTPVITSSTSACGEIAGNAALLVDPTSIRDLSRALEAMTGRSEIADRYRELGSRRVRQFTWEKCAKETIEVYERSRSLVRR